jgi:hypothetical protein
MAVKSSAEYFHPTTLCAIDAATTTLWRASCHSVASVLAAYGPNGRKDERSLWRVVARCREIALESPRTSCGLFLINVGGRVVARNTAGARMLKNGMSLVHGRLTAPHGGEAAKLGCMAQQALAAHDDSVDLETVCILRDGQQTP